jgi:3-oxoacyl-[acyl-carrier-protein] synthase III
MRKTMNQVKVVSTGHYVPEQILTNFDLEKIVQTTDEWIRTRTGIKNRRIAKGENTSDLASKAALDAIQKSKYDASKIDLIIVATFTPDYASPAVANMVQAKLGLNDHDITCFDINAACTGFIYALNVATQMLQGGHYQSALVIGAEVISKVTDWTNRDTCVLFGDGAGAIILENTEEEKTAYFYTASKGDLDNIIYVDNYVHMDGQRVYQFATRAIESSIAKVLNECNLTNEQVTKIIPHQANLRIIQNAAKNLHFDMDKFFINIDKYGNTSAASIIIALDEYIGSLDEINNQKIILVGFGAGFTWGSALLTL